jgi:hypothetical protein
MNGRDAQIAFRALNLDGGEGSGVKGHTTEHPIRGALDRARSIYSNETFNRFAEAWHEGAVGHQPANEAEAVQGYIGQAGQAAGISSMKDEFKKQLAIRAEQSARQATEAARMHAEGHPIKSAGFANGAHVAADIHAQMLASPKGQALARYEKLRDSPPKEPKEWNKDTTVKHEKAVNSWRNKVDKKKQWYLSLGFE